MPGFPTQIVGIPINRDAEGAPYKPGPLEMRGGENREGGLRGEAAGSMLPVAGCNKAGIGEGKHG
jgi:hypothetical protein